MAFTEPGPPAARVRSGGPWHNSPVSDERKVVTVLFADCVGSTPIGEQLDPEELATVMRAFFDEMRAADRDRGRRRGEVHR